jgi:threonine aldolase
MTWSLVKAFPTGILASGVAWEDYMADDFTHRRNAAFRNSTRMLIAHGRQTQAAWLRELADWIEEAAGGLDPLPDRRGVGAEVTDLEEEVADLLGKPAAVLMPSGIMAQQAALRAWAERSGRNTVGLHDKSHFLVYELDAIRELHGLRPVVVTEPPRPTLASDLAKIPEPLGVLTVEIPLRDCGHVLPSWDELVELSEAAADRGVPFHMDGARIWESAPFLGHTCAQIADLAGSVYVSLYKGLGGMGGALLAGPQDFIEDARRWRVRHGGNLPSLFPLAAAGRIGLRRYLPQVEVYVERAREIAAAIQASGVGLTYPSPPHTNTFRVFLTAPAAALNLAVVTYAEDTGVWSFPRDFRDTEVPGWAMAEFIVGEATLPWRSDEVVDLLAELRDRARSREDSATVLSAPTSGSRRTDPAASARPPDDAARLAPYG